MTYESSAESCRVFITTWNKKRSCRYDSHPYCLTADYLLAVAARWYLQLFSRYCALNVLGLWPWPFRVWWLMRSHRLRHRSVTRVPLLFASLEIFFSRTHRLATFSHVTDDRRMQRCTVSN